MADDATLGVKAAIRLNLAHGETRRARSDDHIRRQQLVELAIEFLLEVDSLGPVFLDKVRACDGGRHISGECNTRLRSAGRKAQSLKCRPSRLHKALQSCLGIRGYVGRY